MIGGHNTLYNNQPIQLLKKAAADSIKAGEVGGRVQMTVNPMNFFLFLNLTFALLFFSHQAVWFGCDVGKHFHGKLGINDMNVWVTTKGTPCVI